MNHISPETRKLLALSMLSGIGPATLRKISKSPAFKTTSVEEISQLVPALKTALSPSGAWSTASVNAERQIEEAEHHEIAILSALDEAYPSLLAATKDDPFLLFVRGKLAPNPTRSVGVIGTREPTEHGQVIARRITRFFVEDGWSIVSGLALGCDAIAHREAIDAGGHTVAVLAHGLQMIAPARHRELAEQIIESGGALVSQYPFGREAIPQHFAQRDKTQAGMAQGIVMVQSDLQGGSLHASRAALDYGRWLAVPYPTDQDRSNGEPKIQANLVLADGSASEKEKLLERRVLSEHRIIILRGKADYAARIPSPESVIDRDLAPSQSSIF